MSVSYINSRVMKDLHWSIIQYNYGKIGIYTVGGGMIIDVVF